MGGNRGTSVILLTLKINFLKNKKGPPKNSDKYKAL